MSHTWLNDWVKSMRSALQHTGSSRVTVWAAGITLLNAVLHLMYAGEIDLSVDEAHYALFAEKLDWSYFDHPPMVGWLLYLAKPLGFNEWALRLIPTILGLLNTFLLWNVCQRAYKNATISAWSVILFQLGLITQFLAWGMVPDIPLMTCALMFVLVAFQLPNTPSLWHWVWIGLWLGLAGLSKYTAIVLPAAFIVWLAAYAPLRKHLINWRLGLSACIALLLITPVVYWNAKHDWASIIYQFNHGAAGTWALKNVGIMLAALFLGFCPLLVVLIPSTTRQYFKIKQKPYNSMHSSLMLSIALCYLFIVLWAAGNGNLLPHWGSVALLFFIPAVSQYLVEQWHRKIIKVVTIPTGLLSIILWGFFYILFIIQPVSGGLHTAYRDIIGWKASAIVAQNLANKHNANALWVENWTHASRLAWYAQPLPVKVLSDSPSQFSLWFGQPNSIDKAILIVHEHKTEPLSVELPSDKTSSNCRLLEHKDYTLKSITINRFSFFLCEPSHTISR